MRYLGDLWSRICYRSNHYWSMAWVITSSYRYLPHTLSNQWRLLWWSLFLLINNQSSQSHPLTVSFLLRLLSVVMRMQSMTMLCGKAVAKSMSAELEVWFFLNLPLHLVCLLVILVHHHQLLPLPAILKHHEASGLLYQWLTPINHHEPLSIIWLYHWPLT